MDAPKKIYFTQTENGVHYYTEGIPFERKYTEYVRTDAFIKKACKWLESLYAPNGSIAPCHVHIIEDFRKYMKEK